MTPAQAREVLTRRLTELDTPAVHLRQGDPPPHDVAEEVAAFLPSDEIVTAPDGTEDLDEIRAALLRIDHGTWGACASCGEAIDAERLTHAPYTRLCAACADPRQP